MVKEKNNKGIIIVLVVIIVILLALVILLSTGIISFKSTVVDDNNQVSEWKSVVTIKSFDIDSAEVVNRPNNHMYVTGKFVLEGNEEDYTSIGFSGYCYDTNGNKYDIVAPGIAGHKYIIGENTLDAAESFDYGKNYDIYDKNSDKNEWKNIKFEYCKFDKMTTFLVIDEKTIEISEPISFEKSFN